VRGAVHRRVVAGFVAVVLVGACSSGGGAGASPEGASPTPSDSISATLAEWSITLSSSVGKAGKISFRIKNSGANTHEFLVVKTDTQADQLPVENGEVPEEQLTIVDEAEDIEAGAEATLTIDNLEPGHYAIICNIEEHYGKGMQTDFTVAG
jgi:uncharacterized cupredoxin-like copper-binding protein